MIDRCKFQLEYTGRKFWFVVYYDFSFPLPPWERARWKIHTPNYIFTQFFSTFLVLLMTFPIFSFHLFPGRRGGGKCKNTYPCFFVLALDLPNPILDSKYFSASITHKILPVFLIYSIQLYQHALKHMKLERKVWSY